MNEPIETYLLLGFALSVVATVGGVVVVGTVLVKLPPAYCVAPAVRQPLRTIHPLVRWTAVFLKNLLGTVLVALGLIMSVPGIPGPGIITILIGLMLLEFAEKRRWAAWVISRQPILRADQPAASKVRETTFRDAARRGSLSRPTITRSSG